jgi:hypothetical protein
MEERPEGKKVRRIFTAEQKFEILKDIERCKTIKEGIGQASAGAIGVSQVEAAVSSRSAGVVAQ